MVRELRLAHRRLLDSRTLAACAIVCLAVGIGATTATWSVVSRVLLRPLPFFEPDRLVAIHRVTTESGPLGQKSQSPANYVDLARQSRQLKSLAAITRSSVLVSLPSAPLRASEYVVTGNFFQTLGAHALLGRLFEPPDDRVEAEPVAIVSHEFWRRALGGDPAIVRGTLVLNGERTRIVGVLPAGFQVPIGARIFSADVWQPIRLTPEQLAVRDNYPLETIGRLAPGATIKTADAELRGIFANLAREFPELRGASVRVAPLRAENTQALRRPLALMLAAVFLVLAIAISNVVALLLARGVERQRELAIRTALGAPRWDIMRGTLAECLVLVAWGLALGIGCAVAGVKSLGAIAAAQLPQLNGLSIDGRVLAFAGAVAIAAAVACAIAPAWRAARVDPQDALRGGRGAGAGREHHRALRSLVIAEIAVSMVLLVGAGLLLRSFAELLSTDPGFDPQRTLTLHVNALPTRYKDRLVVQAFVEPTLAAIRAVPGVEGAGVISSVPFVAWGNNTPVRYRWSTETDEGRLPVAETRRVSPGFFDVTRQRLIAGRFLERADDVNAPLAFVVNEALVRRDFQGTGRDPIGASISLGGAFGTIVGVVSDIKNYGPLSPPVPETYMTLSQAGIDTPDISVMVRTRDGNPLRLLLRIGAAVATMDPGAAISDAMPMTQVIARSLGGPHFFADLLGTFAAVAVFLATAGVYGMLSYSVSQRTREIGVRSALGGTPAHIIRLVAGEGLRMASIGIVIGAIAAFVCAHSLAAMLHGISPLDGESWAAAIAGLLLIAAVSAALPARRAARIAPVVAMKAE